MSDRTYPRAWFRVGPWDNIIDEREFVRETDKMLFAKRLRGSSVSERRVAKSTIYERWYPEREEAEVIVAARRERETMHAKAACIRDAAPDLLAALVDARAYLEGTNPLNSAGGHRNCDLRERIDAIIARATLQS